MNNLFFLEVKCEKNNNNTFYARYDFAADDKWVLTYGLKTLPVGEKVTSGNLQVDISDGRVGPQYKCPYCGNTSFVQCGRCNKLTCYSGKGLFTCAYCGDSGEVAVDDFIKKVDISNSGVGQ